MMTQPEAERGADNYHGMIPGAPPAGPTTDSESEHRDIDID